MFLSSSTEHHFFQFVPATKKCPQSRSIICIQCFSWMAAVMVECLSGTTRKIQKDWQRCLFVCWIQAGALPCTSLWSNLLRIFGFYKICVQSWCVQNKVIRCANRSYASPDNEKTWHRNPKQACARRRKAEYTVFFPSQKTWVSKMCSCPKHSFITINQVDTK